MEISRDWKYLGIGKINGRKNQGIGKSRDWKIKGLEKPREWKNQGLGKIKYIKGNPTTGSAVGHNAGDFPFWFVSVGHFGQNPKQLGRSY